MSRIRPAGLLAAVAFVVLTAGSAQAQTASAHRSQRAPRLSRTLRRGHVLSAGQALESANRRFELVMQRDGNLVLYRLSTGQPLWASRTATPGSLAAMQSDGNFVVYSPAGQALFATATTLPGSRLEVQDDGNVVIYAPDGRATWSTAT